MVSRLECTRVHFVHFVLVSKPKKVLTTALLFCAAEVVIYVTGELGARTGLSHFIGSHSRACLARDDSKTNPYSTIIATGSTRLDPTHYSCFARAQLNGNEICYYRHRFARMSSVTILRFTFIFIGHGKKNGKQKRYSNKKGNTRGYILCIHVCFLFCCCTVSNAKAAACRISYKTAMSKQEYSNNA